MSILYVVATPIGNLGDLTARASEVLRQVSLIAAEDTRHTGQLLSRLGISQKLVALHEYNERASLTRLLSVLAEGRSIALVSDAGTPLISDPGYGLVKACRDAGVTVVPVPGVSAVTAALSVAGLPTDRFCFEGFLPARDGARREALAALAAEPRTLVFFEAPHRIARSLRTLSDTFGSSREVTLCRELTKKFEQVVSGSAGVLADQLEAGALPAKGEFVVVVAGFAGEVASGGEADELLAVLLDELPPSRAAAVAARLTGQSKSSLYQRALALKAG